MKKLKNAKNRVAVYIYIDILSKIWNAFAKEKECNYLNANKCRLLNKYFQNFFNIVKLNKVKNKKDDINSTFYKICVQIE